MKLDDVKTTEELFKFLCEEDIKLSKAELNSICVKFKLYASSNKTKREMIESMKGQVLQIAHWDSMDKRYNKGGSK